MIHGTFLPAICVTVILCWQISMTKQCQVTTRLKNIKNVGIADQQKAGKQGRDDSINCVSIHVQLHPIPV